METLKVSTKSSPNSVAGAMAGVVRSEGEVVVQVVGAGALNQAVKAIAIARGYVEPSGIDLVCVPTFAEVEIDGEPRTAIRLVIGDRTRVPSESAPSPETAVIPPVIVAAVAPAPAGDARPRIGDSRPAPRPGPDEQHPRATA